MPDLTFQITDVEPATRGLVPLLIFHLEATNTPPEETIQSATLQMQIQFQCPQRPYTPAEKEKLLDLFGTPERWGQTLRNRLWTHATATLGTFNGNTTARVAVPCTFDLNISAAKYFYALDQGVVPLLFLFSGTVFYSAQDGRLQAQRIPHDKECTWRMPATVWRDLMDHHWPNTAWLTLERDVFDRLSDFKRTHGLQNWEQTIERLLQHADAPEPILELHT